MTIAILAVIGAVLMAYTLAPAFRPAQPLVQEVDPGQRRLQALRQEKINHLKAIKDIDFELATGKISAADHEELKTLYSLRAAEAIEAEKRLREEGRG